MHALIVVLAAVSPLLGLLFSIGHFSAGSPLLGLAIAIASLSPGGVLAYLHHRRIHAPFMREMAAVKALEIAPPKPAAFPMTREAAPPTFGRNDCRDRPAAARTMLPTPLAPDERRAQMKLVHTDGRRMTPAQLRRRLPR